MQHLQNHGIDAWLVWYGFKSFQGHERCPRGFSCEDLVVVLYLKFDRVALLRPLLAKHHLAVVGIVLDCYDIAHVVAESVHCVVFTRIYR